MEDLVLENIQGLSIFGYNLPRFRFLFVRLASPEAGKAWLRQLIPEVTMGRRPADRPLTCLNVAFTATGLAAMGVNDHRLAAFDDAFKSGIEGRADILGDTGSSHPSTWAGGLGTPELHAVLMLFATEEDELQARSDRHIGLMKATDGVEILSHQDGKALEPKEEKREHFGFRDGLTRVILDGTGAAAGQPLVKPGEFILGYEDEAGGCPGDGDDLLADGSYLVYRKIYQDVAAWRRWLAEGSARLKTSPTMLAAKAMGRWPDGAPVVLAPDEESATRFAADGSPDSEFNYSVLDRDGMRCPFGSHIRRAHPRDDPANAGSNRHLLMRRGLPYGDPLPPGQLADDGEDRGLAGVFVNADIQRQFERVQHWLNDPKMRGRTHNDKDPIAGDHDGTYDFTLPGRPFARRLTGLPRFTRVCGGAYLFAPGAQALGILAGSPGSAVRASPRKEPAVTAEQPSPMPSPADPDRSTATTAPEMGQVQVTGTPAGSPGGGAAAAVAPKPPKDVHTYLTTIATIKPGKLDRLRAVLAGIAQRPPNEGALASIGTVHFARWAIIDGGTRLLFISTFDGDLDDYLEDFIREGSEGLDLVWSNCEGYPEGGARDKAGFKKFVADMAVENAVCYSAYPEYTLPEVTSALRAASKFRAFVEEFQS